MAMKDVIALVARFALAAVWLYSGIVKLTHPLDSQQAIAAYELLPGEMISFLAVALPALEIILGMMFLLGLFLRPAAIISGIVLIGFIAGLISAWARGLQIDCGCFGGGGYNPEAGPLTYLKSLSRDTGFLILTAVVWWRPLRKFALYP